VNSVGVGVGVGPGGSCGERNWLGASEREYGDGGGEGSALDCTVCPREGRSRLGVLFARRDLRSAACLRCCSCFMSGGDLGGEYMRAGEAEDGGGNIGCDCKRDCERVDLSPLLLLLLFIGSDEAVLFGFGRGLSSASCGVETFED
jgi:hypothetical protein